MFVHLSGLHLIAPLLKLLSDKPRLQDALEAEKEGTLMF